MNLGFNPGARQGRTWCSLLWLPPEQWDLGPGICLPFVGILSERKPRASSFFPPREAPRFVWARCCCCVWNVAVSWKANLPSPGRPAGTVPGGWGTAPGGPQGLAGRGEGVAENLTSRQGWDLQLRSNKGQFGGGVEGALPGPLLPNNVSSVTPPLLPAAPLSLFLPGLPASP